VARPGAATQPTACDRAGAGAYHAGGYQVTVLLRDPALNTFSVASPYTTKLPALTTTVTAMLLSSPPLDSAGVRCDQVGRMALRYSFETSRTGAGSSPRSPTSPRPS